MAAYSAPDPDSAEEAEPDEPEVELPSLDDSIKQFDDWEEATRENRELATRDRDYKDGIQWTADEIAELEKRGQPVVTENLIARKVNFILGEELAKRVAPVARPRTSQHEDSSRAATDMLRFVSDEQDFDYVRSAVTANMLVEGVGGALKELEDDGKGGARHVLRHIHYDRIFWDPHSRAVDFADARYLGVVMWMDVDEAIEKWPDAEQAIREALNRDVSSTDEATEDSPRKWASSKRQRVKIVEKYDEIGGNWYRSCFTAAKYLEEPALTGYVDEDGDRHVCPLKLVSCYVDRNGNRYGLVRALISPQDEVNKRRSKALWAISVNAVVAERDAVIDQQKFQTELAKPDGYAEVEPGALQEGRVQIRTSSEMAQGDLALLQEAKQAIDTVGPSQATVPGMPDSASGRAVLVRQKAASQELSPIFDALHRWTISIFELDWLCIRQTCTEETWARVTDDAEETGHRFVALNRKTTRAQRFQDLLQKGVPPESALGTAAGNLAPLILRQAQQQAQMLAQQQQQQPGAPGQPPPQAPPLAQVIMQHPAMAEEITENQVDKMLVDIVLDEAPDTTILAQEEFDTLSQLFPTIVQARPDAAPVVMRTLIKASQLPNKKELLKELDKGPDPQQVQQQQQAQQMQQQMLQLQMALTQAQAHVAESQAQLNAARAAQAGVDARAATPKAQADIALKQAQAAKTAAEAHAVPAKAHAEIEGRRVDNFTKAVSAGHQAGEASVPGVSRGPR